MKVKVKVKVKMNNRIANYINKYNFKPNDKYNTNDIEVNKYKYKVIQVNVFRQTTTDLPTALTKFGSCKRRTGE